MKIALLTVSWLGSLLFGVALFITFVAFDSVERAAQGFVKYQVEVEVKERISSSHLQGFKEKAEALRKQYQGEIADTDAAIQNKLSEKISSVIAAMCRMDCEKKKVLTASIEKGFKDKLRTLSAVETRIGSIIQEKYLEILDNLKTDLRIFLGSNAALFLLLLLSAFIKPQALRHLFFPSVLLIVAVTISSLIYLFGQNWFFTILYNDYMGFGYLAYVGSIFLFLMDILLNKARITTEIINTVCNFVGSAISLSPC